MSPKHIRSIVIIFVSLVLLVLVSLVLTFHLLAAKIDQTPSQVFSTLTQAYHQGQSLKPNFNLLILGLDYRDDQLEKTQTTDTIMFTSFNLDSTTLNLVSLPRDLWLSDRKYKINYLYTDSLQKCSRPYSCITDRVSTLVGQPIDGLVIIKTSTLVDLVSIVGGVDVYLDRALIDQFYPNPAYIASPSASTPVYITINYPQGWNHLTADNIIPFVRSRKSSNLADNGGTDLGRIARQQQLISALIEKISSRNFYSQPKNLINLYNLLHQEIETDISDSTYLSIALRLGNKLLTTTLNRLSLPVGETPRQGVIYHPQSNVNGQWVFLPSDPDYQQIRDYIKSSLK